MPLVGYSPWSDAANAGSNVGRSLADVLMQSPLLRLQGERLRQEGMVGQAQIGELGARTGLYNAQAGQVRQETEGGAEAAQNMAAFLTSLHAGDDAAATKSLGSVLAGMTKEGKQDMAKQLVQMGSMIGSKLMGPGVDQNRSAAAATGMGAFVTPHNIPRGGTAIDMGGAILGRGADTLAPGETQIPATTGTGTQSLGVTSPVAPAKTGAFNPSAAVSAWIAHNPDATVDEIIDVANKLKAGTSGTVAAPSGTAPTPQGVPPIEKRTKGMRTTTPKGTFEWDPATGWQPVSK